jgi:hypothetical protein
MIKIEAAKRLLADNRGPFAEAWDIVTHALGDPDDISAHAVQWRLPESGMLMIRQRSDFLELSVSLDSRRVSEERAGSDDDVAALLVELCRNSHSRHPCREMKRVIDSARNWHAFA